MKNQKRHIAVFTGSRAEFGLLKPVLDALLSDDSVAVSLIVSGSHVTAQGGESESEIVAEGYDVTSRISVSATETNHSAIIGSIIVSLVSELGNIKPDVLLVYGDRFETFAAVVAATQMSIPTAQIEAGDKTDGGSLDDSVRHAITKLSHLFFTSNSEATNRVLQLGEEDWRVHTVGLTTNDLIKKKDFSSIDELYSEYRLDLKIPIILFTQHSVTPDRERAKKDIQSSISALEEIISNTPVQLVITGANSDVGGEEINYILTQFSKKHQNILFVNSLGRRRYHGFLNWCVDSKTAGGICAGNSSSGIKEAIAFGCPVVNIGERQHGRLAPKNVIHVSQKKEEIISGIKKGLLDADFRNSCKKADNPYGSGDASQRIVNVLKNTDYSRLLYKKFIDRFNL